MTEGTWLAIVAAVSALAMLWVTAAIARRAKQEDYARQDQIAERLDKLGTKTEQIHTLVNSSTTSILKNELVAQKALYVLQGARVNPGKKETAEMAVTASRVVELEALIEDRILADEKALAQVEAKANGEEMPEEEKEQTD